MAFDTLLADRVREYLAQHPKLKVEEKKMFRGLAFMVNGKMCVSVSGSNLMCRFDPSRTEELAERQGYLPMKMNRRVYKGYCYVESEGIRTKINFEFWLKLCLDFNPQAKASKK